MTTSAKHSKEYFEEIEEYRYRVEPFIHQFAQFSRYNGKKVLEVGVGAGTDFLQWVRSGACANGIDLTSEAIENVRHRLKIYGLEAESLQIGDGEKLPFPDNTFDLVYSWGVIHHSPDTIKALEEIIRVTKKGGRCKIMVYNRYSMATFYNWLKYCALKGNPFRSFTYTLYHNMESKGTKGYSEKEIQEILASFPVRNITIKKFLSVGDTLENYGTFVHFFAKSLAFFLGWEKVGWFLTFEFEVE